MPGAKLIPRKPRVRKVKALTVRTMLTARRSRRQVSASHVNLAHTKRPRTAAQLTSARHNLRKIQSHHRMTASRRVAMLRNLSVARSKPRRLKTPAQQAAARANLGKVRHRPRSAAATAANRRNLATARLQRHY